MFHRAGQYLLFPPGDTRHPSETQHRTGLQCGVREVLAAEGAGLPVGELVTGLDLGIIYPRHLDDHPRHAP